MEYIPYLAPLKTLSDESTKPGYCQIAPLRFQTEDDHVPCRHFQEKVYQTAEDENIRGAMRCQFNALLQTVWFLTARQLAFQKER